jgi:hypothetical protein
MATALDQRSIDGRSLTRHTNCVSTKAGLDFLRMQRHGIGI